MSAAAATGGSAAHGAAAQAAVGAATTGAAVSAAMGSSTGSAGAPLTGPLQVSVVTPDGPVFEGAARTIVVPGHDDGEVAFLPGHAAYVGLMGYGVLRVDDAAGASHRFGVYGGFVQVLDNRVIALAKKADAPAAVTPARLEKDQAALAAMPASTDEEWAEKTLAQREIEARRRLAGAGAPAVGGGH